MNHLQTISESFSPVLVKTEELSSYQVLFQIRASLAITLLILVMLALHYRPTDSPDVEALITWAVLDDSTPRHGLALNTMKMTPARYGYP